MNSKQRVKAALQKQPVDRPPVFMWFQPGTAKRLAEVLEISVDRVAEAMGNDIRQTWVNNNYAMEGIVHERDGEGHTDFWGIGWKKEGAFNQIVESPLADADRDQVLNYRFPTDRYEELLALMQPVMKDKQEYFIGADVSPCVFEMYWRLRGLEKTTLEIAADPELTDIMHTRCADFAVDLAPGLLPTIRARLALDRGRRGGATILGDEPEGLGANWSAASATSRGRRDDHRSRGLDGRLR